MSEELTDASEEIILPRKKSSWLRKWRKERRRRSYAKRAPRVLHYGSAKKIRAFLIAASDDECEGVIESADLADCLIRFYRRDDGQSFRNGRLVAKALRTYTLQQTQRKMITDLITTEVGSYHIQLLHDLQKLGFKIQNKDVQVALIHAIRATKIIPGQERAGDYARQREEGVDAGLGLSRRLGLPKDDPKKRNWIRDLRRTAS